MTRRFSFGLALTLAMLLGAGLVVYWRRDTLATLPLADIGGFLSGVVAPIAFLWIILGYLQQGEELQLNTQALRLQQEELRRQVVETAALVRHSETQALAAKEALLFERQRYDELRRGERGRAQPVLAYVRGTASGSRGQIIFLNTGGRARHLSVAVGPLGRIELFPTDCLSPGQQGTLDYEQVSSWPALVSISYTDDYSEQHTLLCHMRESGAFAQDSSAT